MTEINRERVFISYAHEDLDKVRKIAEGLGNRKLNVWFDKERLGPGRWKTQIVKAISRSRYFVICISQAALRKTGEEPGFQDDELNTAYGIAQEQPDKDFTIIPVRIEECGRGDFRISGFQQYDLFDDFDGGLDMLAVQMGGVSLADAAAVDKRSEEEKNIEGLFGKAMAALFANDFENALNIFNALITIAHNNVKAWYGKGMALSNLGRHEEALAAFNRSLQINPEIPETLNSRGAALNILGRHEEALASFDSALEKRPDSLVALSGRGSALIKLNRQKEALAAFDKALTIESYSIDALMGKGVALSKLGRFEEALAAFNIALEIKPELPELWGTIGETLRKLGRHQEADIAISKANNLRGKFKL